MDVGFNLPSRLFSQKHCILPFYDKAARILLVLNLQIMSHNSITNEETTDHL